jgi:hypothetical protein
MSGTWEAARVGPNLGQDHFRQAALDTWDCREPLDLVLIGVQALGNFHTHTSDGLIQLVTTCWFHLGRVGLAEMPLKQACRLGKTFLGEDH